MRFDHGHYEHANSGIIDGENKNQMCKKIKILCATVIMFLSFPAHVSFATTSCAGSQEFIGFSPDGSMAYWEEEIGGECSRGKELHQYDFRSKKSGAVATVDLECYDYPCEGAPTPKEAAYLKKMNEIKKNLTTPAEDLLFCEGKELFVHKDSYLGGGPGWGSKGYLNGKFGQWFAVSEECNAGDAVSLGGRCDYNGVYILEKGACHAANFKFSFKSYPVKKFFSGKRKKIDWESQPRAKMLRGNIEDEAPPKRRPNFAGHYLVLESVCDKSEYRAADGGEGCMDIALIDLRTSNVYFAPFKEMDLLYQIDSSLFIVDPSSSDPSKIKYYLWNGSKFVELGKGEAVCNDSDDTNYKKLHDWAMAGDKTGMTPDFSITEAGEVTISNYSRLTNVKRYKDACKKGPYLLEQACDGGVRKEERINCAEKGIGGTCITKDGLAYCKMGCCIKGSDGHCNPNELPCPDKDEDGVPDIFDNCPNVSSSYQDDSDGDGIGNACDFKEFSVVSAVSAGEDHTCALLDGGKVKCWGGGSSGQLGNGASEDENIPVDVSGLSNAKAISAGYSHTCALLDGGKVKCWGQNGGGQLGDGTYRGEINGGKNTPVDVCELSNAKAISAGGKHTCAILDGGKVKCWGNNGDGQLGNGANEAENIPVDVSGLSNAKVISAGGKHTCALLDGGKVKCWGQNWAVQGGKDENTPVDVSGLSNVKAISAGYSHTCAILDVGKVKCWGRISEIGEREEIPVDVCELSNAKAISAGHERTCALLDGGKVGCWGGRGPLVKVSGFSNVKAISIGDQHACALLKGGTVKCWGVNWYGQLGDGTEKESPVPVSVKCE